MAAVFILIEMICIGTRSQSVMIGTLIFNFGIISIYQYVCTKFNHFCFMVEKIIRDIDGNVITEKPIGEVEIIRLPFRCVIKRNGQEDATKGNRVAVRCSLFTVKNSTIHKFNSVLWGFNVTWLNHRIGRILNFANRDFFGDTWKDAFEQAENYFNDGCNKYEYLIHEREQALKNAE